MPVKLYYLVASPPARAVHVLLNYLNIPYELVDDIDLLSGQLRSEDFLKLNPQHTIPVIVDEDGFVVCDSHAINIYLVNKYAKDDKLYPKELKAKSIVDHRLFFDCGSLFQCFISIARAYFFEKSITGMNQIFVDRITDVYDSLERYLSSTKYIAGDHVTIADFSVLTSLGNAQIYLPWDEKRYPKLAAYVQRGYATIPLLEELNKSGLESLKELLKDFNFQVTSTKL